MNFFWRLPKTKNKYKENKPPAILTISRDTLFILTKLGDQWQIRLSRWTKWCQSSEQWANDDGDDDDDDD